MSLQAIRPYPGSGALPLLVTGDSVLLDEVLRVAGRAGAQLEMVAEPGAARGAWSGAPLVLVGVDVVADVVRRRLPRRAGIVLVARDLDDGSVWQSAVSIGAEHVVFLPAAEGRLIERFIDATRPQPSAPVVCVVGARGGAGASTLATTLALAAARRGYRCMLIDADPLGGGLDLMLAQQASPAVRRPDPGGHCRSEARCGSASPEAHVPLAGSPGPRGDLRLLSWDRGYRSEIPAQSMRVALSAGRSGTDLVVVDLPRRPDAAAGVALPAADTVLLVVPAEVRATVSAARVAAILGTDNLAIVVRGMAPSGHTRSALSPEKIAAGLGFPLAGHVPADRGPVPSQTGRPSGARGRTPWVSFCQEFLDRLELPAVDLRGA